MDGVEKMETGTKRFQNKTFCNYVYFRFTNLCVSAVLPLHRNLNVWVLRRASTESVPSLPDNVGLIGATGVTVARCRERNKAGAAKPNERKIN